MPEGLANIALAPTEAAPGAELRRPYRAAWIHALGDGIERLPGPTWLAYLVLTSASVSRSARCARCAGSSPD